MIDNDKALVERLREGVLYGDARLHNPKGHDPLHMEAADRIEALSAENERLREALVSSTKCLRETASRVGSMHGYWDIIFDNESILKSLGHTK